MSHYADPNYWNTRYENDKESFEWYQHFVGIQEIVEQYLEPESKILIVGCGNSKLCSEIYDLDFKNITCIDFSEVVIE